MLPIIADNAAAVGAVRSRMSAIAPITTAEEGLSRSIAEQLKQADLRGANSRPADRLNEAALATRMGTSRGPIREAIRILTGTGLVTPVVNRGVFVRQVSIREMLEIYDLRALVFGFAAARAAENVTDAHRAASSRCWKAWSRPRRPATAASTTSSTCSSTRWS
jgi:DNA-binding GntR family transcriptional regulator